MPQPRRASTSTSVLALAAAAEADSEHPLARAIVAEAARPRPGRCRRRTGSGRRRPSACSAEVDGRGWSTSADRRCSREARPRAPPDAAAWAEARRDRAARGRRRRGGRRARARRRGAAGVAPGGRRPAVARHRRRHDHGRCRAGGPVRGIRRRNRPRLRGRASRGQGRGGAGAAGRGPAAWRWSATASTTRPRWPGPTSASRSAPAPTWRSRRPASCWPATTRAACVSVIELSRASYRKMQPEPVVGGGLQPASRAAGRRRARYRRLRAADVGRRHPDEPVDDHRGRERPAAAPPRPAPRGVGAPLISDCALTARSARPRRSRGRSRCGDAGHPSCRRSRDRRRAPT